jgi:phosphoesterase RecJ-like protein
MLGLYSAILDNYKKQADMIAVSKIPEIYKFLPNINLVKQIEDVDKSLVYDLAITVDVAAKDRIGDAEILFDKAKFKVNIDHHITNTNYADLNLIGAERSSVGEHLFFILESMKKQISLNTANCLYTAILTDTGSFRFDNTKQDTFLAASELVKLGVKVSKIYKNVYESDRRNLVQFQGYCLSKAEFLNNDKIAFITVYRKDMEKFGANDECFEGLTEKLRAIVTTEVAFVAKEMKSGNTKFSFRSKNVDVSKICEIFSGGGHKFASGCTINKKPEDAVKMVLDEVEMRVN